MPLPDWADEDLARALPSLCARGESQEIEFMVSFPQQARELGKEIAAFASSNPGTILIGVSNDGVAVGIPQGDRADDRDSLICRIQGICGAVIKPPILPTVQWAITDGKVVLVLHVPKGNQPVYYVDRIPYIRNLTESRPAEPDEVVNLVHQWDQTRNEAEQDGGPSRFYTILVSRLDDIVILGEEAPQRAFNPWLHYWRDKFKEFASDLRHMSSSETAHNEGVSDGLNEVADALDEAGTMQLTLGCGKYLNQKVIHAVESTTSLKAILHHSVNRSEQSVNKARAMLVENQRRLKSLVDRSEKLLEDGRFEDMKDEASGIGYNVLKFAYFVSGLYDTDVENDLKVVGHSLHLLETEELSRGGDSSPQSLCERILRDNMALEDILERLERNK